MSASAPVTSSNDLLFKAGSSALVAFALNKFLLKEEDMKKNLVFGLSTGAGIAVGSYAGSMVPVSLSSMMPNGKGVSQRALEIALGGGVGYAVNTYALKNSTYGESLMSKIGIIVASDLVGEYISDYLAGRPLAIFE